MRLFQHALALHDLRTPHVGTQLHPRARQGLQVAPDAAHDFHLVHRIHATPPQTHRSIQAGGPFFNLHVLAESCERPSATLSRARTRYSSTDSVSALLRPSTPAAARTASKRAPSHPVTASTELRRVLRRWAKAASAMRRAAASTGAGSGLTTRSRRSTAESTRGGGMKQPGETVKRPAASASRFSFTV